MRQYVEGRFKKIQRPQNSAIVVLLKRQVASTHTTTTTLWQIYQNVWI